MRRQLPSLQSLICFDTVAKCQSHTYAAQALFITQSSVSRQIQKLENFLGVQLFYRTAHGVELTEVGRQYFEQIAPHLMGLEKCTTDIMSHKGLGGTLKVAVVPTFATRWLVPKLPQFSKYHPQITVQLETSTKPFLFNEHQFDMAIFTGTATQIEHWPAVRAHFLMKETLIPVCAPKLIEQLFPTLFCSESSSYQLSDEQLLKMPLLQQTTRPSIWQEWFQSSNLTHPNPFDGQRQELFSMLAIAASCGMGMALIPHMLIESELQARQLVSVSNKVFDSGRSYYIVHSSQNHSLLVDKFVDWLVSCL